MKTLKFDPTLIPLIQAGTKTVTWRVYDDKDIQSGYELTFFNSETGEQFGIAWVTGCSNKTLGTLSAADMHGHEAYASPEELLATYRQYYGDQVDYATEVKVITFTFEPRLFSKITVVNEADEVIGAEYMPIAIAKGCIRRAAAIVIVNEREQVLIQKRSERVNHPGKLDISAAGQVDAGETYGDAAKRELAEELGVVGLPLKAVGTPLRVTNFFIAVYRVDITSATEIVFDTHEVAEVLWYDVDTLQNEMVTNPDKFTLTCREVWVQVSTTFTTTDNPE